MSIRWILRLLVIWMPLRLLAKVGLDDLYATRILRWERDAKWELHYHDKRGMVWKPCDWRMNI